ncbi:regulatory protein [Streptomyces noursei ATCC 11455]|uniref:tetratricopeptide repeat protein n=1 Tax=Streptomyces noursei TaxID=1971 RepID=UPI00081D32EB|nr:regulatory protein [Streptomyces noursei ATCC 11455]
MTDQAVDGGHRAPDAARGPGAAARERRATLPRQDAAAARSGLPGFAGRRHELKALRADIGRAGLDTLTGRRGARSRVLLIAGRPGSGRTTLAEALLREIADEYPDGVLRAVLTGRDAAPTGLARTARDLLAELGADAPPGADEDELAEAVRTALAGRRTVLLLDDAPGAEHVEPLIPDAPDCLVVVVSQGPLTGIPDVRPCALGGLDTAAAVEVLCHYAGPTRVTVDPRTAEAVAEECGGQPAALILAGAWLAARPKLSVADLRQALLAVPLPPDLPAGDRPLHRAFRLTYDALPQPAARILRLATLAPDGLVDPHTAAALGGCTVPAAAAVLHDFAALGLVRPVPEDDGPHVPPADAAIGPRYRLPGCLVPFSRELIHGQERPADVQLARARMLERTVRLVQSCRAAAEPSGSPARRRAGELPRSLRFATRAAAAHWLHTRRGALLDAARMAVADGQLDTLDRRLITSLTRALLAHYGPEAAAPDLYTLHALLFEVAERRALPRERAAALLNLGDLDAGAGRQEQALTRYRGALESARAVKDPLATGRALESLGDTYTELGDWVRAADWYGRALELRLARGERADAARLHARIGAAHGRAGRHEQALKDCRAAARTSRRLGDAAGQARAAEVAADVHEHVGQLDGALRSLLEALDFARAAADGALEVRLQLRIAEILDRLGDPAAARLHRAAGERRREEHPE